MTRQPGPERPEDAGGDDLPFDEAAFDEAAMQRFPREEEWLDLEPPAELPLSGARSGADFVERTLDALRDDRQLDRDLAELDAALPGATLQAFAAPAPSADFAARCCRALQDDRRHRWQQMLARHVAPEPSPEFVSRTLQALATDPGQAHRRPGRAAGGASWWRRTRAWPLLAAAAGLAIWLLTPTGPTRVATPLEFALAVRTSPALARGHTAAAMPAVLAAVAQRAEPDALVRDGADGLWLLLEGE